VELFLPLLVELEISFQKKAVNEQKEKAKQTQEKQLTEKIDGVQARLQPFENLANKMYPSIETDAALGRLYREMQDIKEKTQRLSPRAITGEQKLVLLDALRKLGKHDIRIIVSGTDAEASQFAVELRNVFLEAGWDVPQVGGALFSGPPIVGIHLRAGQNPAPTYLWVIHDVLKQLGFAVQGSLAPNLKGADVVQIIVGGKPQY
jgi:hypothetical protein